MYRLVSSLVELARSVAIPQQTHTELAAQATQTKQPPNFLSPLGRLMDI